MTQSMHGPEPEMPATERWGSTPDWLLNEPIRRNFPNLPTREQRLVGAVRALIVDGKQLESAITGWLLNSETGREETNRARRQLQQTLWQAEQMADLYNA